MAYGFEIRNADNTLAISDNTRQLQYVGQAAYTGSLKPYSGWNGPIYRRYRISGISSYPVVFVKGPMFYQIANMQNSGGGVWDITVGSWTGEAKNPYFISTTGDVPAVHVYQYAPTNITAPSSSYGLVVYDANGKVCFDSNKKSLFVEDVWTGLQPGWNYGSSSWYWSAPTTSVVASVSSSANAHSFGRNIIGQQPDRLNPRAQSLMCSTYARVANGAFTIKWANHWYAISGTNPWVSQNYSAAVPLAYIP